MLAIGIDIGGTKIAGGVVDERGRLLRSLRVACPAGTPAIVDEIVAMIDELSAHDEIGVVGVAAAGFVSEDRSTIAHGPNIEWSGPPLKHQLEPRLATSVVLENDANAAAWGEYRFGAACETTNAVMLTVGTGVGGRHRRRWAVGPWKSWHGCRTRTSHSSSGRATLRVREVRLS